MNREEAKKMFREDRDAYGKPKAIMHKLDQIFDEFEKNIATNDKVVEKICILRCKTCEHWKPTTFYDYPGAVNDGKCNELKRSMKMEIELKTGWDGGYVDYIETTSDFGCTEHKLKTNEDLGDISPVHNK